MGILRRFAESLTDADMPIIAIGTFDTDYDWVRSDQIEFASTVLARAG